MIPIACTTGDHEDEVAVGEALIFDDSNDSEAWWPFCGECLTVLDPPKRWWTNPLGGHFEQFIDAVDYALVEHAGELAELHHAHVRLDANARYFIARIAVAAVATELMREHMVADVGHFGDGWQGPGVKQETPSGSRCVDCDERIADGDQGYLVRIGAEVKAQHRRHRAFPSAGGESASPWH